MRFSGELQNPITVHPKLTTTVDDASELFVAEISSSAWSRFCESVSACLMELDGEDPLLDAYLHRSFKDQAMSIAQKISRRPSIEGNKRRYSMGEEGSEVIQLAKDIEGLKEEVII